MFPFACYPKYAMLPVSYTKESFKAFVYGFLSVLTFGLVPSYLAKDELPRVDSGKGADVAVGACGLLQDFSNVARDIARAAAIISKQSKV